MPRAYRPVEVDGEKLPHSNGVDPHGRPHRVGLVLCRQQVAQEPLTHLGTELIGLDEHVAVLVDCSPQVVAQAPVPLGVDDEVAKAQKRLQVPVLCGVALDHVFHTGVVLDGTADPATRACTAWATLSLTHVGNHNAFPARSCRVELDQVGKV